MFFAKCAWVKPLKDKIATTVLYCFIEVVNKSKCAPNKLWVNQENVFYNSLIQKCLDDNYIVLDS